MRITIKLEDVRDPMNSCGTGLWIEDAADCDGSVCGSLASDPDGSVIYPPLHHHIVVKGQNPETTPRRFLVS